ncbi:MAG TPA: hypothetical protein VFA75_10045 [Nevskia sp.]|nr:hypothetical protein [Nevskia sp.]
MNTPNLESVSHGKRDFVITYSRADFLRECIISNAVAVEMQLRMRRLDYDAGANLPVICDTAFSQAAELAALEAKRMKGQEACHG